MPESNSILKYNSTCPETPSRLKHHPATFWTPFRYPINTLQTPFKYSCNIRHIGLFLLVKVRCGFLFLLLFLWQGENKVNSYSDQLKLGQVCKFGVEFDNTIQMQFRFRCNWCVIKVQFKCSQDKMNHHNILMVASRHIKWHIYRKRLNFIQKGQNESRFP